VAFLFFEECLIIILLKNPDPDAVTVLSDDFSPAISFSSFFFPTQLLVSR